jgi:hypothetical protein
MLKMWQQAIGLPPPPIAQVLCTYTWDRLRSDGDELTTCHVCSIPHFGKTSTSRRNIWDVTSTPSGKLREWYVCNSFMRLEEVEGITHICLLVSWLNLMGQGFLRTLCSSTKLGGSSYQDIFLGHCTTPPDLPDRCSDYTGISESWKQLKDTAGVILDSPVLLCVSTIDVRECEAREVFFTTQ